MTLRVGPTSLDRVDGERLQHRISSLPLLSVEKVYLFTDDATQVFCVVCLPPSALLANIIIIKPLIERVKVYHYARL